MTKRKQIWKCNICGNIIEVLHEGADSLVCCNEDMNLQEENTKESEQEESVKEKHLPVIENNKEEDNKEKTKVKVGEIEHPMTSEHYIEWIEAQSKKGYTEKIFLNPEEKPEAEFSFSPKTIRVYCNVHGLWKKNMNIS